MAGSSKSEGAATRAHLWELGKQQLVVAVDRAGRDHRESLEDGGRHGGRHGGEGDGNEKQGGRAGRVRHGRMGGGRWLREHGGEGGRHGHVGDMMAL